MNNLIAILMLCATVGLAADSTVMDGEWSSVAGGMHYRPVQWSSVAGGMFYATSAAATSAPPSYIYPTNGQDISGLYAVGYGGSANGTCAWGTVYYTNGAPSGYIYSTGNLGGVWFDGAMLNGATSFVIAGWIRRGNSLVSAGLAGRYSGPTDRSTFVSVQNNKFYAYPHYNSGGGGNFSWPVSDTNWHHVAVVFNGAGATDAERVRVWLDLTNKSLSFDFSPPAFIPTRSEQIQVGVSQHDQANNGYLRDLIWTLALDTSIVTSHYSRTRPESYDAGWWTNCAGAELILRDTWSTNAP